MLLVSNNLAYLAILLFIAGAVVFVILLKKFLQLKNKISSLEDTPHSEIEDKSSDQPAASSGYSSSQSTSSTAKSNENSSENGAVNTSMLNDALMKNTSKQVFFSKPDNKNSAVFSIKNRRTTIGRLKDNDFIIPEKNVSGHHAVLLRDDAGNYTIQDKNSTNGLFVNNKKIESKRLNSGDSVKFGSIEFIFLIDIPEQAVQGLTKEQLEIGKKFSKEVLPNEMGGNIHKLQDLFQQLNSSVSDDPKVKKEKILDFITKLNTTMAQIRNDYKDVERAQNMITTLFETSHVISSILDMNMLLSTLMDLVIAVMNAERGFIMLKDEEGILLPAVARKMSQEIDSENQHMVSKSIAERSFFEKKPILTTDAQEDPRFMSGKSIIAYNIRSVMTVPLFTKDDVIGVIYIDNQEKTSAFSKSDLHFLTMFASQAAIAIENARLYQSVEKRINELSTLADIIRAINSTLDLDKVLNLILDMTIDLIGVEKGSIVLYNEKKGKYYVRALKGDFKEIYIGAKVELANSAAGKVAQTGQSIILNKLITSGEGRARNMHSALLAVALKIKNNVIGVLNLSNKKDGSKFTDNDLSLVESLAYQAAQACENARLYENVKSEEKMRTNLTRFLSPDIANAIIQEGTEGNLALGGKKKEVTMLFTDLRNFTSTCEKMEPSLLVTTLNEYFSAMTEIIFQYGGTLDKFMGDAIMVLFGAPFGHEDDPLRAVCTGFSMLKKLEELQEEWKKQGKPVFSMGIGVHTGEVIAGNIGSEKRMEYTVIGRNVNRASRLESSNKELGTSFLISKDTLDYVKDKVIVREAGAPHMKGIEVPEMVYEVTGIKEGVMEELIKKIENEIK
jgi:adenylate cyclase